MKSATKPPGLPVAISSVLAHGLDVLAVHQHLHFHLLEALAHGVGDQPGDGQVIARSRGRGGNNRRAARNPAITRKVNIYRKETIRWRIVNPLLASLESHFHSCSRFIVSFPS